MTEIKIHPKRHQEIDSAMESFPKEGKGNELKRQAIVRKKMPDNLPENAFGRLDFKKATSNFFGSKVEEEIKKRSTLFPAYLKYDIPPEFSEFKKASNFDVSPLDNSIACRLWIYEKIIEPLSSLIKKHDRFLYLNDCSGFIGKYDKDSEVFKEEPKLEYEFKNYVGNNFYRIHKLLVAFAGRKVEQEKLKLLSSKVFGSKKQNTMQSIKCRFNDNLSSRYTNGTIEDQIHTLFNSTLISKALYTRTKNRRPKWKHGIRCYFGSLQNRKKTNKFIQNKPPTRYTQHKQVTKDVSHLGVAESVATQAEPTGSSSTFFGDRQLQSSTTEIKPILKVKDSQKSSIVNQETSFSKSIPTTAQKRATFADSTLNSSSAQPITHKRSSDENEPSSPTQIADSTSNQDKSNKRDNKESEQQASAVIPTKAKKVSFTDGVQQSQVQNDGEDEENFTEEEVRYEVIKEVLKAFKDEHFIYFNFLENYINIEGYSSRDYNIQRIHELASNNFLMNYVADNSLTSENKAKNWKYNQPIDAQLVLHLFLTFMDIIVSYTDNIPLLLGKKFSQAFYCAPDEEYVDKSNLFIKQISYFSPHFIVCCDNTYYEVPTGNDNLFRAIALFAHLAVHNYPMYFKDSLLASIVYPKV